MGRKQVITPTDDILATVKKLGALYATYEDIAAWFNVSRQTVYTAFKKHPQLGEALEEGKGKGRISLRQSLFKMSKAKPPVAIFLAKNILGMTDKQEISGPDGGAIKTITKIELVAMKSDVECKNWAAK